MKREIADLLNFKACAENAPEGAYEDCKKLERLIGDHMDELMTKLRAAGLKADNCDRIMELEAATYQYVKASNPDATVFPISEGFGLAMDTQARDRVIAQAREGAALWHKLADERSAEIVRLDSVNAALLEALNRIADFENNPVFINADSIVKSGEMSRIAREAIAKAKAEQS